jgi:hypothetical protein
MNLQAMTKTLSDCDEIPSIDLVTGSRRIDVTDQRRYLIQCRAADHHRAAVVSGAE